MPLVSSAPQVPRVLVFGRRRRSRLAPVQPPHFAFKQTCRVSSVTRSRSRKAGSVGAAATTPAVAAACAPPPRPRLHRWAPRPPSACAPCRPARPSLATRARASGLERGGGQPWPHPRARAERRALRLAAHPSRSTRWRRSSHPNPSPDSALGETRPAKEHLVTWSGLGLTLTPAPTP